MCGTCGKIKMRPSNSTGARYVSKKVGVSSRSSTNRPRVKIKVSKKGR